MFMFRAAVPELWTLVGFGSDIPDCEVPCLAVAINLPCFTFHIADCREQGFVIVRITCVSCCGALALAVAILFLC